MKELSIEAARLLEPALAASGGRDGKLSVQTDPRLHRDAYALVAQALEFSQLAENVIVKIPATATGIAAMEEAAYRGVSINATLSFTVPQAVAVGEGLERALDRRSAEGLPEREFGHVVTIMGGRLDDWLKAWTAKNRILTAPGALDWAGVAALRRAYAVFLERGFRSRILSAAFRNHLQWSELVGGDTEQAAVGRSCGSYRDLADSICSWPGRRCCRDGTGRGRWTGPVRDGADVGWCCHAGIGRKLQHLEHLGWYEVRRAHAT